MLRIGGTGEAPVSTRVVVCACIWLVAPLRAGLSGRRRRVFLVAFGGEADVVELDFVDAELRYVLGQGDVVVLNLGVGGIGPDQLAVLTPGRFVPART